MTIQSINAIVQRADAGLAFRFNPSTDIESEDDEFELMREGKPYRHQVDGETYGYTIQVCTFGGGYAANRHHYDSDGELSALTFLGDARDIRAAANVIGAHVAGALQ